MRCPTARRPTTCSATGRVGPWQRWRRSVRVSIPLRRRTMVGTMPDNSACLSCSSRTARKYGTSTARPTPTRARLPGRVDLLLGSGVTDAHARKVAGLSTQLRAKGRARRLRAQGGRLQCPGRPRTAHCGAPESPRPVGGRRRPQDRRPALPDRMPRGLVRRSLARAALSCWSR